MPTVKRKTVAFCFLALLSCTAFAADSLTDEERAEVQPQKDEFGATYKYRVPTTTRKESLFGRPSVYSEHGYSPYKEYLLNYFSRTDRFGRDLVHLSARVDQVVDGPRDIACTFAPDQQGKRSPDILLLHEEMLAHAPPAEQRLRGHTAAPWRLLFSRGGHRLLSCSDDGSMRLWDVEHGARPNPQFGQEIAKFPCYKVDETGKAIRGDFAAFSPYGRWLATAFEQEVSFRKPENGLPVFVWKLFQVDTERIMAIHFDPLGNNLFAFLEDAKGSEKLTLKFLKYDIDARRELPFFGKHAVVDGRATADGNYVVTWDGSSEIMFWDLQTRREIAALKVANEHVYDVSLSPKGDVVATAGDDGEVKFWKIADRTRLDTKRPFKHEGVDWLKFLDDGKFMTTGSDDGWVKGWVTPEFFWSSHLPGYWLTVEADGTARQTWTDSTTVTDPDGNVTETFPDGTVKTYKQQ